jgi:hypothetical protein
MEILIISCIFGKKFKKIYPAPILTAIPLVAVGVNELVTSTKCLFFTNNSSLKQEIESKGWTPVFINMPLSDNSTVSSVQSKYIKFLQFLNNNRFKQLKEKYKQILYFDHKFHVFPQHINKLIELCNDNESNTDDNTNHVIIRETPTLKTSIWDEVNASKGQDRYKLGMNDTIALINNKIKNKEIQSNIRICNTGLIFYNNYTPVIPMLNQIYLACTTLMQPECQIFWAIYSQQYTDLIKTIPFPLINPLWKCP